MTALARTDPDDLVVIGRASVAALLGPSGHGDAVGERVGRGLGASHDGEVEDGQRRRQVPRGARHLPSMPDGGLALVSRDGLMSFYPNELIQQRARFNLRWKDLLLDSKPHPLPGDNPAAWTLIGTAPSGN